MLFEINNSVLVVVDVQGDLAYKMVDKDSLFFGIKSLIRAAKILDIPCLCTEQVPEKIGKTIKEIKEDLSNIDVITKKSFSCCLQQEFFLKLKALKRKQIIICGIEAHVCIFQTVTDLIHQGFEVGVVVDAISSRSTLDRDTAITRMSSLGATMLTVGMLVTELMRTSDHPKFREILKLIK